MHENLSRNRERQIPFKMVLSKALDYAYAFKIPEMCWGREKLKESYSTERSDADVFKP